MQSVERGSELLDASDRRTFDRASQSHPQHHDHDHDHDHDYNYELPLSPYSIVTTTFVCIATPSERKTTEPNTQHQHTPYHLEYIPESQFDRDDQIESYHSPQSQDSVASTPSVDTDSFSLISPRSSIRRALTHPVAIPTKDAMNITLEDVCHASMPDSPPDLSGSKSSKSSSFHSSYASSDHDSIAADISHFEDIGLDDEIRAEREIGEFNLQLENPNPFTKSYDLRSKRPPVGRKSNSVSNVAMRRELIISKNRPAWPSLRGQVKNATETSLGGPGLGLMPVPGMSRRGFTSPSTPTLASMGKRNRSPSPASSISAFSLPGASRVSGRRGSWQSTRERKSQVELEKECDEDDGDDVPDDLVLENVPISPRPPEERMQSLPPSPKDKKEKKEKTAGNGTPLVPVESGSLRSPLTPNKPSPHRNMSMGQFPLHSPNGHGFAQKGRAKSWTAALSELSEEAKSLTAALEEHADSQSQSDASNPQSRSSTLKEHPNRENEKAARVRVQSSLAELPPLRRTDIMVDPLPISLAKSWLYHLCIYPAFSTGLLS